MSHFTDKETETCHRDGLVLSPVFFRAESIQKKISREEGRICTGLKLKLDGPQINPIHSLAYLSLGSH